jgi:hypothetical protein
VIFIIFKIRFQNAAQSALTEDQDVVEALTPDRTNECQPCHSGKARPRGHDRPFASEHTDNAVNPPEQEADGAGPKSQLAKAVQERTSCSKDKKTKERRHGDAIAYRLGPIRSSVSINTEFLIGTAEKIAEIHDY